MTGKVIGRTAQRIIRNSLRKSKPSWKITVPKYKYREIADMVIRTDKHNVIVKVKTTKSGTFRPSMFAEHQLSAWNQHHMKAEGNLSLLFFYFADAQQLISVDIHTILTTKINKLTLSDVQEMGYTITNWKNIYRYFNAMMSLKENESYRKRKRCVHHWLIETIDESFRRSHSRRHSMGYCKKCGRVRTTFENFLKNDPVLG